MDNLNSSKSLPEAKREARKQRRRNQRQRAREAKQSQSQQEHETKVEQEVATEFRDIIGVLIDFSNDWWSQSTFGFDPLA